MCLSVRLAACVCWDYASKKAHHAHKDDTSDGERRDRREREAWAERAIESQCLSQHVVHVVILSSPASVWDKAPLCAIKSERSGKRSRHFDTAAKR